MHPDRLAARGDHAGLWDWNLATNRVHFSPRWIAMVGSDGSTLGNSPDAWLTRVHPDDLGEVRRQLDEHLAGGASEFDLPHRLVHRDGTYRWTSCHMVVVRNEAGQAVRVMGCHSDVTSEKVSDPLTGLPNRLLFVDHLARALERARRDPSHRFAVLLVDLGRRTPHDDADAKSPDLVLTAAARRLETCLRAGDGGAALCRDHLVARLRGDEFAILLDGLAEVGDARVVADRVLGDLLSSFMVGGDETFLSSSVGIAVSATGYANPESVVRDADTALHRATLLGGRRCEVFDTAILRSAQNALQIDTDFMEALGRGEFVLAYQPVVSLATHRVAGFEALVRWQHPSRGLIAPSEFIPIAEQTGFIVHLGRWSLREACLQLAAWQQSQPGAGDAWVSVNLSSPQLSQPALVDDVAQALRDTGLPARSLVVELTESVALENPAAAKSLLMQLRAMGIRVALDDFGTGQSSLSYLHQFPADKLKLDRSFVCDLETRADVRDIVAAVTGLAHQFGLEVIAEGVETEGQLQHVRAFGCEYVQGYFFSRPVDKERAAELLRTGFTPRLAEAVGPPSPDGVAQAERLPEMAAARGRSWRSKTLYVAVSAAVIVALAGLLTRFIGGPSSRSDLPAASASAPTASPAPSLSTAPVAGVVEPLTPQPAAPGGISPPPPMAAARPAATAVISRLTALHKHALRGCRGQLTLTSAGLAYVPEKAEDKAKDGFSLRFGEFQSSVSGDELVIKAHAKSYRFKAADAKSDDEGRSRIGAFGKRLEAARPAGSRK